jgi:hypothetical protein
VANGRASYVLLYGTAMRMSRSCDAWLPSRKTFAPGNSAPHVLVSLSGIGKTETAPTVAGWGGLACGRLSLAVIVGGE